MGRFRFIDGLSRKPLVNEVDASITTGSSKDFGQFRTREFSRLTGFRSTVGSLTLRIRSGADSGQFAITSLTAVNSGVFTLDMLNFGQFTAFDITAAQSTVYSLLLQGEPLR